MCAMHMSHPGWYDSTYGKPESFTVRTNKFIDQSAERFHLTNNVHLKLNSSLL